MRFVRTVLFLVLSILAVSCLFSPDREARRGTIVDNEVKVGRILLADGSPAADAEVLVYPVDHTPGSPGTPKRGADRGALVSTRTDSNGYYDIGGIPLGHYNILAESEGLLSYHDSISLSSVTPPGYVTDTLGKPGSIHGIVGMQPNHDPRSATVQVLGTYSYVNVDSSGRFYLDDLADGRYTIRVVTTQVGYTPLYGSLVVHGGETDTLADTLWIPFTGIPVVKGLTASYDTASAIVTLAWQPAPYRNLQDYVIEREDANQVIPTVWLVGRTTKTSFRDSLPSQLFFTGDTSGILLKYGVRARNHSDSLGDRFYKIEVRAMPLTSIKSDISLEVIRLVWDGGEDSVVVRAKFRNPHRRQMKISWFVEEEGDPAREKGLDGTLDDSDFFAIAWPREKTLTVRAAVQDDGGSLWEDTLFYSARETPLPPESIPANQAFQYQAIALSADSNKASYSISNLPAWATFDSDRGVLSGTPTNADTGSYDNIAITVNGVEGSSAFVSFRLVVTPNPWTILHNRDTPTAGGTIVEYQGDLIQFARDRRSYRYYLETGRVVQFPQTMPFIFDRIFAVVVNGKVFAYETHFGNQGQAATLWEFDPETGAWTALDSPSQVNPPTGIEAIGDHIYLLGQEGMDRYDTELNEWNSLEVDGYPRRRSMTTTVFEGKIYAIGGSVNSNLTYEWDVFDPALIQWTHLPDLPRRRSGGIACASDEGIYLLGGEVFMGGPQSSITNNFLLGPGDGSLVPKADMPYPYIQGCAVVDGTIYYVGNRGVSYNSQSGTVIVRYEPGGDR